MIIIGEKLNSSIPAVFEWMAQADDTPLIELIKRQEAAGASFLDVNTAICGERELEQMLRMIALVKNHSGCGIMIDSTDPKVIQRAVQAAHGMNIVINSTTLTDRFDVVVSLALQTNASVVALPIDDDGIPHTVEEKCGKADALIEKLRAAGILDEQIYLDVLIETVATNFESAKIALQVIAYIFANYPNVKTTCGLSNISFGLPERALINSAFLSAALVAGLSSAILDPMNPTVRGMLAAANAVSGNDYYCMEYITYIRGREETG